MADDQARRVTWTVLGAVAGVALLGAGAVVVAATAVARKLVTPPSRTARDGRVVAVGEREVTLSRSVETTLPGRYGYGRTTIASTRRSATRPSWTPAP